MPESFHESRQDSRLGDPVYSPPSYLACLAIHIEGERSVKAASLPFAGLDSVFVNAAGRRAYNMTSACEAVDELYSPFVYYDLDDADFQAPGFVYLHTNPTINPRLSLINGTGLDYDLKSELEDGIGLSSISDSVVHCSQHNIMSGSRLESRSGPESNPTIDHNLSPGKGPYSVSPMTTDSYEESNLFFTSPVCPARISRTPIDPTSPASASVSPDSTAQPTTRGSTVQLIHCDRCNQTFISEHTLERHKRVTHDSQHDMPHACPRCNKGFETKTAMARHVGKYHNEDSSYNTMRRRSGGGLYPCPFPGCTKEYTTVASLRGHQYKKRHLEKHASG